jgi:plastocyanin
MQRGAPTVIVLRNQDRIRHGFTSELFKGLLVMGEGEGVIAYGKGVEGFYVDPGKTLVLRFRMDKPGSYAFRCDLHPAMKGELYMLEVPTA